MIHTNDFNQYSQLNESQKKKLQAVYNTVKYKDIVSQAFDALNLGGSPDYFCETSYVSALTILLQACNRPGFLDIVNCESDREEIRKQVDSLLQFFRVLENPSFSLLKKIDDAAQASPSRLDEEIDELYNEVLDHYRAKMEAMDIT